MNSGTSISRLGPMTVIYLPLSHGDRFRPHSGMFATPLCDAGAAIAVDWFWKVTKGALFWGLLTICMPEM